jgi:hypothetical protein
VTSNNSIKIKALFLLIVFATNTVVGFACALGVDMGFNKSHHSVTEATAEVHIHANGKKHVHEKEALKVNEHTHQDGSNHKQESNPVKQIAVNAFTNGTDGCCSNEVQKFQNLDKNVTVNTSINLPVFIAILSVFLNVDLSNGVKDFPSKYKSRFFYPPPPDIRIAMQRFQI